MNLTPREKDKLLIAMAATVARRRLERGVKLNHPEAIALISDFVVEGARDGRSVAELMRDPDIAQPFQVERAGGAFDEGEWMPTAPTVLNLVGIVQPAKREDMLAILPEGARLGNMIVVFCDQELRIDNAQYQRSDVVVWHGNPYRVVASKHWSDHGYWQVWAEGFVR